MNKWPWLGPRVTLLCLLKLLDLSCQYFIPMGPVGSLSFTSHFSIALAWQTQWAEPHHCCCFHIPLPSEQSCVPGRSPSALQSPLSARGLSQYHQGSQGLSSSLGWVSVGWHGQHWDRAQPQVSPCHSDCGTVQGLGLMLKQWPLALQLLSCTLASPRAPVPLVPAPPALGQVRGGRGK